MLSESAKANAKASRKRYDAEKMDTLAVKLPVDTAKAFRAYAAEHQTTVSRLLANCIRRILDEGGEGMDDAKSSGDNGNKQAKVTYSLWRTTIDGMKSVANQTRVPVDDLVNAVLCEWLATWNAKRS